MLKCVHCDIRVKSVSLEHFIRASALNCASTVAPKERTLVKIAVCGSEKGRKKGGTFEP